MSISELLERGLERQQRGERLEAERCYRQVLAADAANVDAWHLLGVLAYEAGPFEVARQCLERAIALKPDFAEAHYNLGNVHYRSGRHLDAITRYAESIRLKPAYFEAHNNLGNALKEYGDLREAEECYRRVLKIKPGHANAHFNLGQLLKQRGALIEAEAAYRRAVAIDRGLVDGWLNLGLLLQKQGKTDEALGCFQAAAPGASELVEWHYAIGLLHFEKGDCQEAAACFERAVRINPNYSHAWNDWGNALKELSRLEEAIACFQRAVTLAPGEFKFHSNLAVAQTELASFDEAKVSFERALAIQPENAAVRWNRALLLLLRGDFEEGWREYEWRWKAGELVPREFCEPRWRGEPLAGRTLLLYGEQGLGDTLQFVRYAAVVKELGARVVLECQKPLGRVLRGALGVDALVIGGEALPAFDFQIPLLSVPGIVGTDLGSIPTRAPYLFAEAELVAKWRARLEETQGFRVGINWHGREGRGPFRKRDIPLACFARLAEIPGVRLVSLQKDGSEEIGALRERVPIVDLGNEMDRVNGAFVDTAAIMAGLDLVITSDTSIPHLAGALGVPVWVVLPSAPDWRWLLERGDSPWYPTMRLFRQRRRGDWEGVFEEMGRALEGEMERRGVR